MKAQRTLLFLALSLASCGGGAVRGTSVSSDLSSAPSSVTSLSSSESTLSNPYAGVTDLFEDGCYYLGDYECYEQNRQMTLGSSAFGRTDGNFDPEYVKHGLGSLYIEILGRGAIHQESQEEPMMSFRPTNSWGYCTKTDYGDCDYFEFDIYNIGTETCGLTFCVNDPSYYAVRSLPSGWSHIQVDKTGDTMMGVRGDNNFADVRYFGFIFDRGDLHGETQKFYLDNFRAHQTLGV